MVFNIVILIILSVSIAVVFWVLARTSSERILKQYRALSKRFTLELSEPPAQLLGFVRPEPFVHGEYRRREMSISAPAKGLQNTRQTETSIKIRVVDRGLIFQMTAAGLLANFKQRDGEGLVHWSSGDGLFDSAVNIKASDGDRLGRLLNEDWRSKLRDLLKQSKATVYLSKGVLTYDEIGLIADDKTRMRIEEVVETLYSLGELVDGR